MMKVKTILGSGIMERRNIRSGRIYQEGAGPQYGVIFTSNQDRSDNDLQLDPQALEGAFIGSTDASENDQDRFFKILGGYYYQDNYPDSPKTTHVFGIAKSEFGVTDGGANDLSHANWKLQDPDKPYLEENRWSKNYGKHHGWTFIVTLKEREKFPKSDQALKIFRLEEEVVEEPCPQLTKLQHVDSDKDANTKTCQFTLLVSGDAPEKCEWDFGDGHKQTTTALSVSHDYSMPVSGAKSYTVEVTALGPRDCTATQTTKVELQRVVKPTPTPPSVSPPKICTFLPLIVAFLLAMTVGTILISCVQSITRDVENDSSLAIVIFAFSALTIVALVFWLRMKCPRSKKDWLAIGWVTLFAGFLLGCYMVSCIPGWWWAINLVELGLAGLLFMMFRKCGPSTMETVLYAIVCVVAFLALGFVIAQSALGYCV